MSRRSVVLGTVLTFACAGQPAPAPKSEAPPTQVARRPLTATSSATASASDATATRGPLAASGGGATPAAAVAGKTAKPKAGPAKPPEPTVEERIAALRAAMATALPPLADAVNALAAKNVTSDQFEKARAELRKLEALEAEAAALEKHDGELAMQAVDLEAAAAKARPVIDARWAEVGAALQKPALDNALRNAQQAVANAKQKTASAEQVAKAEAAVVTFNSIVERGASVEAADVKYAEHATTVKAQKAPLEQGVADAKAALAVRQQAAALAKAKAAAEASLVALRKTTAEAAFEATDAAIEAVRESLATGQPTEAKDAEYAKQTTAARAWIDAATTEIGTHRVRQKVEAHKVAVEAARKSATEAAAALPKAADAAPIEASEKSTAALEAALAAGKDFGATDKKYADYAAVVAKEIEARKAAALLARQNLAVKADRTKLETVASELDGRTGVYKTTPSAESLAAAEKAAGDLESALKGSAELAAKDKTHAAYVAQLTKKLADQRNVLLGTKNDQAIAAHRAELAAARTALAETMTGLKGKLDYESYAAAAKQTDAYNKAIGGGEPLGATNAKYAAELAAAKNTIPGFEMQARRTWIEAADADAKAKIEALKADKPAEKAFTEAEKAVKVLATTAESSKMESLTDKSYVAFVAGAEKQVVAYRAQIDARRVQQRLDGMKVGIEAASAQATTAVGALDGEPAAEAFGKADGAVKAYEDTLDPDSELAKGDAPYFAEQKKKIAAHKARIGQRRVEVIVVGHKKKLGEANAALAAALKAPATAESLGTIEKAAADLSGVVDLAGPALEVDAKYAGEVNAAKARVEPARAEVEKRRTGLAVAANKAEVEAAATAASPAMAALSKPDEASIKAAEEAVEALEGAIEEGEAAGAKSAPHAAYLAGLTKKVAEQRAAIGRARVALEVAAHRATVDAEKAKITAALAELSGKTEDAPYAAADKAISGYSSAISGGGAAAEKDAKYAAELKARGNEVMGLRMQVQKKRVEVAAAAAVEAAKGEPAAAEGAIEKYGDAIEKARKLNTEDKGYAATLAAADKSRAGLVAALEKKRIDAEVAAHREKLKTATEAMRASTSGLAKSAELAAEAKAAEKTVAAVESTVKDGAPVAAKSPAYEKELAAATKEVEKARAAIEGARTDLEIAAHRTKVQAAAADVDVKLGALTDLQYEKYAAAETSVSALEKLVTTADELSATRPAYGKELAATKSKIEPFRITIRTKWIASAESVVAEKMKALEGKPDDKAFKAADDAVVVLARTVESGRSLTQAPAYQKSLVVAEQRATAYRAKIDQRRVDIVVDVHRAELDAAEKGLAEAMKGLAGKPDDKAFKAAETAVTELVSTLESGANAAERDPAYGKRIAALEAKVPGMRSAIEARRVEVEIAAHKEKLDEALKAVLATQAGVAKGTAFTEPEQAITTLENVIEDGKSAADKSPAYAQRLAAEDKKIAGYKARIAARRTEIAVGEQSEELAEAVAAAQAATQSLADAAAVTAAEEAIGALEEQVEDGAELAKQSPAFAKKVAAAKAEVPKRRAAIAQARIAVDAAAHRKTVEAAVTEAETRVAALGESISASSVKVAERAVSSLETAIKTVPELAAKSPAHTKSLAAFDKKVDELRKQIAKREVETEIKAHRAKVEAAQEEVQTRLGALGKLEYDLFASAETAVASLEKALGGADALVERDPAYGKELAAIGKNVEGYRITIRTKWIDAANAVVVEKLAAMDAKPNDKTFKAADDAVVVLNRTIESGQGLTKAPAYQKTLAASTKQAAGYRSTIDKRRVSIVVDAHKAELEKSEATLAESLGALGPKADEAAFRAAKAAVKDVAETIDSGADAAAKDPAYGKRLAALEAKLPAYEATIEKKQFEVEVSGNKEKITAASRDLTAKLAALSGEPDEGAFGAAESAVGALESAIGEGQSFGRQNKAYGAALAAEEKKLGPARARIAKRQGEVEVAEHAEELAEAQATLASAVKSLGGSSDEAAFKAAEAALTGVEEAIGEGAEYSKAYPAHGRKLAVAKADLPKKRAAIAAARVNIEVAAHRREVEAAAAEVATRVEQLDDGITPASLKAAEGALDKLESAASTSSDVAKKSPAHAKWLAAYAKRVPALKNEIARKSIAKELEAHRREVVAARQAVNEKMGTLGKLDYDLFVAADGAVNDLEKTLREGESLGEQDKAYAKALKVEEARIPGLRIEVRKKWIDAADAEVRTKLAATEAKPDEKSFKAAEDAVRTLNNTIESGQSLSKAPAYQKMLVLSEKKAAAYYATIDRRRALGQFSEVRAELDSAVTAANAAMANAGKDPDGALTALGALGDAIDSNSGAADRDPAHKKKLVLLRKKLAADKAKVAKLAGAAKGEAELAEVEEAEDELATALVALKKSPDDAAISGVVEAIDGVEEALQGKTPTGKNKLYFAAVKKKVAAARGAIARSRGEATVAEHRSQLEAQLTTTREAMGRIKKITDRESLSEAESAVGSLADLVASGKELGKANKKYGALLASVRKTTTQYQTTIKKQRVVVEKLAAKSKAAAAEEDEGEEEATPVAAARSVPAGDDEPSGDPKAELAAAAVGARKAVKAAQAKGATEGALSAAKDALDALAEAADAAKPVKALKAKVAAARAQVSAGRKAVAKVEKAAAAREARLAKAEAKAEAIRAAREAKAEKLAAAKAAKAAPAASDEEEEEEEEEAPRTAKAPAASAGDAKARLGEVWANFTGLLGPLKKKATADQVDAALEAAAEVDGALEDVVASGATKSAKYATYVNNIKKRLKTERGKLTKKKRALAAS